MGHRVRDAEGDDVLLHTLSVLAYLKYYENIFKTTTENARHCISVSIQNCETNNNYN